MEMAPFDLTAEQAVARVRARNHVLRAVLTPTLESAEARAAALRDEKPRSELHRVPYVLKDIWETAGVRTTSGSWRHRGRVPSRSASVHAALEEAGAVMLGKSNLSDLALSPEADNHLVGATCNPYNLSRTSGGSSGGAAAAVADGMAAFDWGSDFGGSIRLPSAFCGVVGLRLSSSAWPSHEHVPAVPPSVASLNGMGPIAPTVEGCRTLLRVLAPRLRRLHGPAFGAHGVAIYAPSDRFSAGRWPTFAADAEGALRAAGFAVRGAEGLPPPMRVEDAYNRFLSSHFDDFLATGEISFSEGLRAALASIAPARLFDDRRLHRHTAQVLLLLYAGRHTIYRNRALATERVESLRAAMRRLWDDGWLVCAPTTTYAAPPHGRVLWTLGILAFTKLGNLTDATCVAVPFGSYANGLPRSLQILGPPGGDEAVLAAAERIERRLAT